MAVYICLSCKEVISDDMPPNTKEVFDGCGHVFVTISKGNRIDDIGVEP